MFIATPRPLYPRERNPIPIMQEAVWTIGTIWVGAENLATSGFDSRIFRTVAELLYRLHYSGNSFIKEPVSLLRDKSLIPAETGMSSQRPQRLQRYRASYPGRILSYDQNRQAGHRARSRMRGTWGLISMPY
jgi:hypothetical protein